MFKINIAFGLHQYFFDISRTFEQNCDNTEILVPITLIWNVHSVSAVVLPYQFEPESDPENAEDQDDPSTLPARLEQDVKDWWGFI